MIKTSWILACREILQQTRELIVLLIRQIHDRTLSLSPSLAVLVAGLRSVAYSRPRLIRRYFAVFLKKKLERPEP